MSGNRCLLDTNIIIDLFSGDKSVVEAIKSIDEIVVPSIVAGELYYGAENSTKKVKHTEQVESFLDRCSLLEVNVGTAKLYGRIKSQLKKQGKPIPENDIWIAALALQHSLPLVTRDKHYKHITHLKIKEC